LRDGAAAQIRKIPISYGRTDAIAELLSTGGRAMIPGTEDGTHRHREIRGAAALASKPARHCEHSRTFDAHRGSPDRFGQSAH
jgi:hypothetical protein